ncbi:MAG: hypothetical protein PHC43_00895 [Candidatus Marinimicrobia bacterium]|jgi:hypothetical protein|nr:hypothetical protein [Candidatus Neomarinimicrobiota bacterium]MDD5229865.1 hypothetical protein [Candidatus Neomarinimicrobiota bacterium]MDD5540759.1 hypothetical protein [Candidatus Neomarinimicrobiota bacterium]
MSTEYYYLIDKSTRRHVSTSRRVTIHEYARLNIERVPRQVNFIFRYNVPLKIRREIALFLLQKYPDLRTVSHDLKPLNITDQFDEMTNAHLIHYLSLLSCRDFTGERSDLLARVRRLISEGRVPMSEEEHRQRRIESQKAIYAAKVAAKKAKSLNPVSEESNPSDLPLETPSSPAGIPPVEPPVSNPAPAEPPATEIPPKPAPKQKSPVKRKSHHKGKSSKK